jgi:hypothetical protein
MSSEVLPSFLPLTSPERQPATSTGRHLIGMDPDGRLGVLARVVRSCAPCAPGLPPASMQGARAGGGPQGMDAGRRDAPTRDTRAEPGEASMGDFGEGREVLPAVPRDTRD